MSRLKSRWLSLALLCAGLSCNIYAVDGVILVDQNRALAGAVTPGDTPGFPVTISLPGSYRLSGNLTVPNANTTAISITASHVTIDLNGFSIIGPTVCIGAPVTSCSPTGTGEGVSAAIGIKHITVSNGLIFGMGGIGIHISGGAANIEKMHIESNGQAGIFIVSSIVSGNLVNSNGNEGIVANLSTVTGNNSFDNHSTGISAICPSVIFGNTAYNNGVANIAGGAGCATSTNAAP
jgi:hypothetical protein